MTWQLLGVLIAGGLAQTALLAFVQWRRDKKRDEQGPLEELRRLRGYIARVERESKERDEALEASVTALAETTEAGFADLKKTLAASVAIEVVNMLMAAIARQKERADESTIEKALTVANGGSKRETK
jgi:hypothetical protein